MGKWGEARPYLSPILYRLGEKICGAMRRKFFKTQVIFADKKKGTRNSNVPIMCFFVSEWQTIYHHH